MWTSVWIWQVKLCDPSLTRANLTALEMSIEHVMKRYTNTVYLLIPEIVRQMSTAADERSVCNFSLK